MDLDGAYRYFCSTIVPLFSYTSSCIGCVVRIAFVYHAISVAVVVVVVVVVVVAAAAFLPFH